MGLYNSIATAVVPGQAAWNNAVSSFQNGNYGTAALGALNMLGQDVLFALTFGESQAATPAFNTTQSAVSQVENVTANSGVRLASGAQQTLAGTQNGVLLGTVENGEVNLFEATAGGIENHAQLVSQGLASQGAQGFSLIIQNGQAVLFRPVSQLNSSLLNYNLPPSITLQIFQQVGSSVTRIIGN